MTSLLRCEGMTLQYDQIVALEDVGFEVFEGERLVIAGENGSGKSTLLKGLLGLMPRTRGTVRLGGGLTQKDIGYLPQQTELQRNFPASVMEVAISGCLAHKGLRPFYSRAERQRAREALDMVGMGSYEKHPYGALSGGQQQRVALARALCAGTRLLLLDEPVTGLDPAITAELYRLLDLLHKEHGMAMVMVSHDIQSALEHADKVLHLKRRTLFYGTQEDYRRSPIGARWLGGTDDDMAS